MISLTDLFLPSPAPHFKTFQVFLIYCPKRPSFSTIEGLCQWKIPVTPSGIESATFLLVAQWLNQLRHQQRAPFCEIWTANYMSFRLNTVKIYVYFFFWSHSAFSKQHVNQPDIFAVWGWLCTLSSGRECILVEIKHTAGNVSYLL